MKANDLFGLILLVASIIIIVVVCSPYIQKYLSQNYFQQNITINNYFIDNGSQGQQQIINS